METIRIGKTKFKFILTSGDMERMKISAEDISSSDTRDTLMSVIMKSYGEDIPTGKGRVLIQMYPSRDGGCELFATFYYRDEGEKETAMTPALPRYKFSVGVYELPDIDALLSVCDRLKRCSSGESSAFADNERGSYYLIVCDTGSIGHPDQAEMIAGEYGGEKKPSASFAYIKEHCVPICESDAVGRLGSLAI